MNVTPMRSIPTPLLNSMNGATPDPVLDRLIADGIPTGDAESAARTRADPDTTFCPAEAEAA